MERDTIRKAIGAYYPELLKEEIIFLEEGSYAKAYRVGSKVFKITKDKDDAIASLKVKGQDLQHIVKVYKVFKIHALGKYLIVSEFIPYDILSERARAKYNLGSSDWNTGVHDAIGRIFRKNRFADNAEMLGITNANLSRITLDENLLEEFYTFAQELWDNGFTNADIHQYNIRLGEDNKFKLIDLGHGTSRNVDVSKIRFEELV